MFRHIGNAATIHANNASNAAAAENTAHVSSIDEETFHQGLTSYLGDARQNSHSSIPERWFDSKQSETSGVSLSEIEMERIFCAIELHSHAQLGTIDLAAFSSFMSFTKVRYPTRHSLSRAHQKQTYRFT